jgi:hypothetical protein
LFLLLFINTFIGGKKGDENSDTAPYRGLNHEDVGNNEMYVTKHVTPYDFYVKLRVHYSLDR